MSRRANIALGWGIFAVLVSCGEPTRVSTFRATCEAITAPPGQARSFAADSVRADFAAWYDSLVAASVGSEFLGGADIDDPVVAELRRLRLVGAWREGSTLHVSNSLLYPEGEAEGDMTLSGLAEAYRNHLVSYRQSEGVQRCIFTIIDGFFDRLIIHGPGSTTRVVETSYFMSNAR